MGNIFTKFRRIGQTLERLTIIAEQVSDGVAVADSNGTIRFVNAAMAKMHGHPSSRKLIGEQIGVFHTDEQMEIEVFAMIEEVERKGRVCDSIEHLREDGSVFPTETKMILLKDEKDHAAGFAVFVTDLTDITAQIQVEESLANRIFKLVAANEQLQVQLDRNQQAEESLNKWASELAVSNENLRQQVAEYQRSEGMTALCQD